MESINVISCKLDDEIERGVFCHEASSLGERLDAKWIGASVYEAHEGRPIWPYHFHHGVEEWLYVVSGAPVLRDPSGERALEVGDLVGFQSGPAGAHTVYGPGRVVMFSAGARGWGEAFVTVYPDSDKIGAAPGVRFRRGDAIDSWLSDPSGTAATRDSLPGFVPNSRALNLFTATLESSAGDDSRGGSRIRSAKLGPRLGAQTWTATLYELPSGEVTAAYHYQWCREEWALVLSGAPTLRHPAGQAALSPGDILCFPEGPTGARRLLNDSQRAARVVVFSAPVDRPMSAFYPDDDTVLVSISGREGFLFRYSDRIEDYWDGEPGAG